MLTTTLPRYILRHADGPDEEMRQEEVPIDVLAGTGEDAEEKVDSLCVKSGLQEVPMAKRKEVMNEDVHRAWIGTWQLNAESTSELSIGSRRSSSRDDLPWSVHVERDE